MPKLAPVVKTLRVGSLKLDIRKYGDGRFGFDYAPPGEDRIKVRLVTSEKAEEKAREILGAARGGKVERLAIDEGEYAEFLRWKAERGSGATVPAVVKSLLEAKKGKGRSVHHMRRLQCDLTAFAESFPGKLESLTREGVERWLNSRDVRARRWNNLRESIIALHRFARKEGVLLAPLTGPEMIEKREVKVKVETYTPEQLEKLLEVVPEQWLPVVVLCALCGLRPMEVCPDMRNGGDKPALQWSNILWAKKKIDVPAEVSKVRRRRFVPISDAAMAFLSAYRSANGPVVPRSDMHKLTSKWAKAAGIEWKHDALRHSYASYKLALTHDMAALALEMGNSPSMIFRHYLDLKHEDEAQAWFAVRPSAKSAKKCQPRTHEKAA